MATWLTKTSEQVFQGLQGGEYVLHVKTQSALQIEEATPAPAVHGTRFDIDVTLRSHVLSDFIVGVYLGHDDRNGHYIGLSSTGAIHVFHKQSSSMSPVDVVAGDRISPLALGTVRLLISVSGGSVAIRVDGALAGTAVIPDIETAVARLFLMSQNGPSNVGFSRFAVLTP